MTAVRRLAGRAARRLHTLGRLVLPALGAAAPAVLLAGAAVVLGALAAGLFAAAPFLLLWLALRAMRGLHTGQRQQGSATP